MACVHGRILRLFEKDPEWCNGATHVKQGRQPIRSASMMCSSRSGLNFLPISVQGSREFLLIFGVSRSSPVKIMKSRCQWQIMPSELWLREVNIDVLLT